ncbi:hypothetical protein ACN469_07875 [Corallococcus terminator]
MAIAVLLGMLLLLLIGGGVGVGLTLLLKKLFSFSTPVAIGVGVVLLVVGAVGLFAVVFDDLTASWWEARTAKVVHFTVPKGFNGQLHLVFDPNGPAVNEVDGKLEVKVSGAKAQKVKAGMGVENDYVEVEAHDTEGKQVDVFLDSSGFRDGVRYRGFWFGDQATRTYDDSPIIPPKE